MPLPEPLVRLVEELQRLPGIGAKSGAASRVPHSQDGHREETDRLADAVREVKERVTYCSCATTSPRAIPACTVGVTCAISGVICVVEEPQNVSAVEKTREFKGVSTC